MRRPHRNIEIFSMSVLDMFASALGAFIVCAIILFPYYKPDMPLELEKAQTELEQETTRLAEELALLQRLSETLKTQRLKLTEKNRLEGSLSQCEKGLNLCQVDLAKNFLLIQLSWKMKIGVDLHVTDSAGNEFFWEKPNRSGQDFPNSKASMSITTFGDIDGGIQVWISPDASAGTYKIEAVLPDASETDVPVELSVFDRYGRKPVIKANLRKGGAKSSIATLEITGDGALNLR